ncbi:hypothetical protein M378DRAFT_164553 [Amanita muscaria Koide BX008]|uniref:Uncharacterized protein n=1 Tax=Amanita muscaria (strain Koide BX008) TaxID=946122 RepID=A0A0C2SJT9_AMAMK|nr:hypothetical protein M378DRAFT_164553 [Amanita muscaria Koide BX008]
MNQPPSRHPIIRNERTNVFKTSCSERIPRSLLEEKDYEPGLNGVDDGSTDRTPNDNQASGWLLNVSLVVSESGLCQVKVKYVACRSRSSTGVDKVRVTAFDRPEDKTCG